MTENHQKKITFFFYRLILRTWHDRKVRNERSLYSIDWSLRVLLLP